MDTSKTNELLRRIVEMHTSLYDFSLAIVKLREPVEEITADVFFRLWERRQAIGNTGIRSCRLYLHVH
jgi:hypothetical protein